MKFRSQRSNSYYQRSSTIEIIDQWWTWTVAIKYTTCIRAIILSVTLWVFCIISHLVYSHCFSICTNDVYAQHMCKKKWRRVKRGGGILSFFSFKIMSKRKYLPFYSKTYISLFFGENKNSKWKEKKRSRPYIYIWRNFRYGYCYHFSNAT